MDSQINFPILSMVVKNLDVKIKSIRVDLTLYLPDGTFTDYYADMTPQTQNGVAGNIINHLNMWNKSYPNLQFMTQNPTLDYEFLYMNSKETPYKFPIDIRSFEWACLCMRNPALYQNQSHNRRYSQINQAGYMPEDRYWYYERDLHRELGYPLDLLNLEGEGLASNLANKNIRRFLYLNTLLGSEIIPQISPMMVVGSSHVLGVHSKQNDNGDITSIGIYLFSPQGTSDGKVYRRNHSEHDFEEFISDMIKLHDHIPDLHYISRGPLFGMLLEQLKDNQTNQLHFDIIWRTVDIHSFILAYLMGKNRKTAKRLITEHDGIFMDNLLLNDLLTELGSSGIADNISVAEKLYKVFHGIKNSLV